VKDKRPVNLDLSTIQLPLAAWASITHRISGVIIFVGTAFLLWALDTSLSGEAGFNSVRDLGSSFVSKFIAWGILTALAYHILAGCKHLLMDFGIGESREAAPKGAKLVIIFTGVLAVFIGGWLW
jgi:succinate dehydrogenase / fumarate reductase cytochrome b subunit